jgi:hypothetical protein
MRLPWSRNLQCPKKENTDINYLYIPITLISPITLIPLYLYYGVLVRLTAGKNEKQGIRS